MGYFTPDGKYFYIINAENNVMNKIVSENMKVASKNSS
jgi:DNA-binding beta-propeller fold protein YncE